MRKIFASIIATLLLVFSVTSIFATSTRSSQERYVSIAKDEVIDKTFYVNGGDFVDISGTVNGDVVVGGGQLVIDGVVNGDLLAAGGTISLSGEVTGNARIAGGQMDISGKIGRNLTVVGGNVVIAESAEIGGGLLAGVGNLTINSPINGDVTAGAQTLTVSNEINGDLEAAVGTLRLTEDAVVTGDVTYYSDTEADINENAIVTGELIKKETPKSSIDYEKYDFAAFGKGFAFGAKVVSFLTALLFGLLMLRFYPNFTKRVATTAKLKFWKSLGVGFLTLIIAPITAFILFVTIIGFPIGVIIMFSYLVFLYTAKIFVAYWAGDFISKRLGKSLNMYWVYVIGLAAYFLVTLIPLIGGLVWFVALLVGLGAVVLDYKTYHELASKSKAI